MGFNGVWLQFNSNSNNTLTFSLLNVFQYKLFLFYAVILKNTKIKNTGIEKYWKTNFHKEKADGKS